MAYRVLEVTLQSAKNLKKVNLMSRLEVYAVATISGDPMTRQCTPPDPYGGRHPTWNATLRFSVPPTAAAGANGCLYVLLRTERSLGDRDIGEVIIPLSEVLAGAGACGLGPHPPQFAVYQVRKLHRAETHGVLYLSYRLGPVVSPHAHQAGGHDPVVAYPVARPFQPHHQAAYSYMSAPALMPPAPTSAQASGGHMSSSSPPSPRAYAGHMALPPPLPKAYGHLSMPPPPPLQASGHTATSQKPAAGYAAASAWTNARNNGRADFGMGLSAGLVGGAIGGMMAGDMMSDAAAYNAGYRAGMAREWSGVRGDRGAVY